MHPGRKGGEIFACHGRLKPVCLTAVLRATLSSESSCRNDCALWNEREEWE